MVLLDGILGNASEIDVEEVKEDIDKLIAPGEKVDKVYKVIRDLFIFTNKRLILIDKQGLTGKKIDYHSIPYSHISHFSIETAGHFDLDAELKIWISSSQIPISKRFNKKLNIYEVQKVLSKHIFNE